MSDHQRTPVIDLDHYSAERTPHTASIRAARVNEPGAGSEAWVAYQRSRGHDAVFGAAGGRDTVSSAREATCRAAGAPPGETTNAIGAGHELPHDDVARMTRGRSQVLSNTSTMRTLVPKT